MQIEIKMLDLAGVTVNPPASKEYEVTFALSDQSTEIPINVDRANWRDIITCPVPAADTQTWDTVGIIARLKVLRCVGTGQVDFRFFCNGVALNLEHATATAAGDTANVEGGIKVVKPQASLNLWVGVKANHVGSDLVAWLKDKISLKLIVYPLV
jgi:hypothetical protein